MNNYDWIMIKFNKIEIKLKLIFSGFFLFEI